MRHLARLTPHDAEGPIALAVTAIEARDWDEARKALEPLLEGRLTQRVATLMARIEGEQHGHTGRVREWLARAVNAPRDPAWTADGVISDRWSAVSPVTGALDSFRWRVPVEAIDAPAGAILAAKVEALVGLGAGGDQALAHPASIEPAAVFSHAETAETIDPSVEAPDETSSGSMTSPAGIGASAVAGAATISSQAHAKAASAKDGVEQDVIRGAKIDWKARVDTQSDDEDLKERIRLAAQRAVAASNHPEAQEARPGFEKGPAASAPLARARKALETKIFVPPRAPDDPGPEPADSGEAGALGSAKA